MWKKAYLLVFSALLLLTGCSGETALIGQSMIKSADQPSADFQGTFKMTGDLDKLLDAVIDNAEEKKEALAFVNALKAGLKMEGSTVSTNEAKIVFTLNDDKILRDNQLWTGDQKAALEMLVNSNDVYVKTPIDQKYLAINSANPQQMEVDAEKLRAFQDKIEKLTLDFMKKYIDKYGFDFSQVKNLGKESVELPDGKKVDATHISVTLDTPELLKMLLYTAKDATANKDVRDFAIEFMTLTSQFATDNIPAEVAADMKKPSAQEQRAEIEKMVDQGLAFLKMQVEQLEKQYTIDQMVEQVKEAGVQSLELKLDYYIDSDKNQVRSISALSAAVKDPDGKLPKPVTIGWEADYYSWNHGKGTAISFPAASDTVTVEQLQEDENAIKAFNDKGFLYRFAQEISSVPGESEFIVFDLKDNSTTLNGEPVAGVRPFLKDGSTMVPFRFIGEEMGAQISYDPATKTATFSKDGKTIKVTEGSKTATVDGQAKTLPVAPLEKDGSLYVPLKFVSEAFGADVTWIEEVQQAIIEFEKAS